MLKIKPKLEEASRKILERGFNMFEGSGVGKIPGVLRLFTYLSRIFNLRMVREVQGYKFSVRASPQAVLYFSERFEPYVTNLYCSLLKEGVTVADVGAGIGYYTLLASKIVGNTGAVLSFEPEPHRFREMVDNIQVNKCNNVEPFELAIADKEGENKFEQVDTSGSGYVVRAGKNAKKKISVTTTTLDSFKNDIDLIKIDIEGAELEALRGMKNILAEGKVKIICEVHPSQISSLGYDTKEIIDLLNYYNYDIYRVNKKGLVPTACLDEYGHYLFARAEINSKG